MSMTAANSPELDELLAVQMHRMAEKLLIEARHSAPVKTGTLRGSLYEERQDEKQWLVGSPLDYAVYTDQGTTREKGTQWFTETAVHFNGEA